MDITNFVKLLGQISVNRQTGWVFSGVRPKNSGWNHSGSPGHNRLFGWKKWRYLQM